MKHLKGIIFFAALMVLALTATVFAENPSNITISECDAASRVVTVSGSIDTSCQNENVILTVLKKGVTKAEYESVDPINIKTVLSYLSIKPLESNGSFSFSFKMIGETGEYVVLIDSKALDSTYETTINFTNTLWDELNALKIDTTDGALQRFRNFIETESLSLAIELVEYNTLSDESRNVVCNLMKSFTETYTYDNFVLAWEKNVIWSFVDANRNNVSSIIDMADEKIENGTSLFNDSKLLFFAENYSDTAKGALYNTVLNNTQCINLETFIQLMKDNLVVTYVHETDYWKDVYNIIEAENNVFEFNSSSLSVFNTLSDKDAVVNALHTQGQKLNTSAEIINLFDALVAAQETEESKPAPTQKPRPSVGGNGGSSWSVGITTPTVPEEKEPEDEVIEQPVLPAFDDIAEVAWAKEAIEYLAEKDILSGVGDARFEPNRHMTREELVKMLDNFFGYSKEVVESNFADADKNAWYYSAISGAAAKGIVMGYENNTFGIGQNITREDAAVILLRAFGSDSFGEAAEPEFSDNDNISDYAKEAVGTLSCAGIISGMGDGSFMPKGNLTRAQAAKMFYGLLQYVEA